MAVMSNHSLNGTMARSWRWLRPAMVAIFMFAAAGAMPAQSTRRLLKGKITDDKGAGLPGVKVELNKSAVQGHTDGRGEFSLRLPPSSALAPGSDGALEMIELTGAGLRDRLIRVTDLSFFDRAFEEKMEPRPAGPDCVGFMALMPESGAFINELGGIKADPPYAFTAGQ